jgi:hypothetical protein
MLEREADRRCAFRPRYSPMRSMITPPIVAPTPIAAVAPVLRPRLGELLGLLRLLVLVAAGVSVGETAELDGEVEDNNEREEIVVADVVIVEVVAAVENEDEDGGDAGCSMKKPRLDC